MNKTKATRSTRSKAATLTIKVHEVRTYIVPEIIQDEVRAAITASKGRSSDDLEELLSCLEYREGAEEIETIKVQIVGAK